MQPNNVMEVEDLTVEFRTDDGIVPAVHGLDFTIGRGETVVLVGESGSGKSLTALAMMGLINPPGRMRAGALRLRCRDGVERDLSRLPEREMRGLRGNDIAMVFQEPMTTLNPVFTIGRQIGEAIVAHERVSWSEANRKSAELLGRLGFAQPESRLSSYPHELSGGMRQRVVIAMALACRPSLLIADEPTTALDVTIQAQILQQIADLRHEFGMSVLFITHNLGVAAQIADRVIVMYTGRTVEEAPVDQLFAKPLMPYTRDLLRTVPRLGRSRSGPRMLPAVRGSVPSITELPPGCSFSPRCDWSVNELCTSSVPSFEAAGDARRVACVRWREIEEASS